MSEPAAQRAHITVHGGGDCLHCAIWRAIARHCGPRADMPGASGVADSRSVRLALVAVLADCVVAAPNDEARAAFCDKLPADLAEAIAVARAGHAPEGATRQ